MKNTHNFKCKCHSELRSAKKLKAMCHVLALVKCCSMMHGVL